MGCKTTPAVYLRRIEVQELAIVIKKFSKADIVAFLLTSSKILVELLSCEQIPCSIVSVFPSRTSPRVTTKRGRDASV